MRSGRDVILRKRSVFVSIAPVPSLCYQFSVQFHTAAEVKKTLQNQDTFILITNADLITCKYCYCLVGAKIERHSTGGPDVAAQRGHTFVFEIDEKHLV